MNSEKLYSLKKVLLVEDSDSVRMAIAAKLEKEGFDITDAKNGQEALDEFKKFNYPVVITDIEMPIMDGKELIGHLNNFEIKPVIIVITSHYEPGMIIEIMKQDVFDYIIKPPNEKELILKINRAFDIYDMNRLKLITEKEKVIRLEQQLEWYKWLERTEKKGSTDADQQFFESLTRSFNQGAGFGSLLTLLNLLKSSAKEKDDHFEISKELYNQIFRNHEIAEKAMKRFSEIDHITSHELQRKSISCSELYENISNIINNLEPLLKIKNHKVLLSDKKENFKKINISISVEYFNELIHEVLVNAMKFSEANTSIIMMFEIADQNLIISSINQSKTYVKNKKGIPVGYENIIFEPFFRISKEVMDEYNTLDFGLGLTLVEKIVQRHNGKVSIFNITDYSDIKNTPVVKVNCSIILPLDKD